MKNSNLIDFDEKMWETWAEKIGHRQVFLFKASLTFLDKKELLEEFEAYIKDLLENKNNEYKV